MSESDKKHIREKCRLHQAQGLEAWCSRESCIYWRLLESQDVVASNEKGCGLQHFGVIEDLTPEMAAWLLNMKKRLENTTPEIAKARITFRRREE
ncbi:MAG: hypothetical protein ACYC6B_02735 [Thermoleophilia bacterium]